MAPERKCTYGKASRRRRITERYRQAHPVEPQPKHAYRKSNGKFAPEPTDAELGRRALVMMGRLQDVQDVQDPR